MSLIEISTGRLIKAIEKHPVLYHPGHELYRAKTARRDAWQKVGLAMFENYKELSTAQRMEIDRALMQRWKTARDAYNRSKTKNIPNSYTFYNMLRFLDNVNQNTTSRTSEGNTLELLTSKQSRYDPALGSSTAIEVEAHFLDQPLFLKQEKASDTESSSESDSSSGTEQEQENIPEGNENVNEDSEMNFCPEVCIEEPPPPLKRRKLSNIKRPDYESEISTVIKLLTETTMQMKNDNMAFFMSMLPIIDKFNDLQKLMFRSEVMKIAIDISSNEANSSVPKPPAPAILVKRGRKRERVRGK